jgi:flagellar hook-associated protein 1
MSLANSLSNATSSLYASSERTSLVSRNIANADKPFYSRKSVELITMPGSGVRISAVVRTEEPVLFRQITTSNSQSARYTATYDALDRLNTTVNDVELDSSPAAMINKLLDALQNYSAQPHSQLSAEAAVRAARNVATGLNSAAATVQSVRNEADTGLQASVDRVNSLLQQFKSTNEQIVKGTVEGRDVTDYLDQRDQILHDLSNEIGVRTVTRENQDMVIYTDSGVTLFDKSPREVSFQRSLNVTPGVQGNAVYIDGVQVTGTNATMPLQSGRIVGLTQARDEFSLTYETQLDEMARVLVTAFAEQDQVGGGADVPGLFTYAGATTIPAAGVHIPGLAAALKVNASVDPDQGGNAFLLRDGGISGDPDYVYNSGGQASYSGRIDQLIGKMNESYTYDPDAKIATTGTLKDYSAVSVGWLQERRTVSKDSLDYQSTLYQRSFEAFTRTTGVNLDEEMSLMLEIERSFSTSSKLISVVDEMYRSLLAAI